MFRLNDARRHRVCHLILLACLMPTLGVALGGLWHHRPGRAAEAARVIGLHLGMDATVDTVQTPRPGVVVYRGLHLQDPETDRSVFRCDRLTVRRPKLLESGSGKPYDIALADCTLDTADAALLRRLGERVLARNDGWPDHNARLAARRVSVVTGSENHAFETVALQLERTKNGCAATVRFRFAGVEEEATSHLDLVRAHKDGEARTTVSLETGLRALPCSLLRVGIDHFDRFESGSWFVGRLAAEDDSRRFQGRLAGQFVTPEGEFTSSRLAYSLSGRDAIQVLMPDDFRGSPNSPADQWLLARVRPSGWSSTEVIADRMQLPARE